MGFLKRSLCQNPVDLRISFSALKMCHTNATFFYHAQDVLRLCNPIDKTNPIFCLSNGRKMMYWIVLSDASKQDIWHLHHLNHKDKMLRSITDAENSILESVICYHKE